MSATPQHTGFDTLFVRNMVEAAVRIGLVFVLLWMTYDIISPFIIPVIWGGIIAIAAFPLTRRLETVLGGRRGLAATLVTLLLILILVVPCYGLTEALVTTVRSIASQLNQGQFHLQHPFQLFLFDLFLQGGDQP